MNANKSITIDQAQYEILVKIAFLISDAKMAEKIPDFGKEMNVDPDKNRALADDLVDQWESMP